MTTVKWPVIVWCCLKNLIQIPAMGYFLNQATEDAHFPSAWHLMTAHHSISIYCHQETNLSECD